MTRFRSSDNFVDVLLKRQENLISRRFETSKAKEVGFNEKITPNTKRFSSPFQYKVPISQAVQV